MLIWLKHLDRVIRGEATKASALRSGEIEQPVSGLIVLGIGLGALYGLCMGSYALFQKASMPLLQLIATTVKVPVLFFLTLAITFPSLYVFNALVGSRLSLLSVVRLLVISLVIMLTVLASLGPIVAFFSASTTSYPFMLLLNVIFYSVAGFLGLRCVLVTLDRLSDAIGEAHAVATAAVAGEGAGAASFVDPGVPGGSRASAGHSAAQPGTTPMRDPADEAAGPAPTVPPLTGAPVLHQAVGAAQPGSRPQATIAAYPALRQQTPAPPAARTPNRDVVTVFRIWILVFGLVGAQMAWVLRPFLGSPHNVFTWFRPRSSNFFEAVLYALQHLFRP